MLFLAEIILTFFILGMINVINRYRNKCLCNFLFYLSTFVVLLNKIGNLHHYFMVPMLVQSLLRPQVVDIGDSIQSTLVVQWLSYLPLDLRFAGSNLAGARGFFKA